MRVVVRVRPPATADAAGVSVVSKEEILVCAGRNSGYSCRFNSVLDPDSTQEDVFCHFKELVESSAAGYNACVLAYGQTGSGKSWSMSGTEDDAGIVGRATAALFEALDDTTESCQVNCSYLEIYGERLSDLMTGEDNSLKIRESFVANSRQRRKRELFVSGLSSFRCASSEEVVALVNRGNRQRAVRSTRANETSSRSHAVLQLVIESRKKQSVGGEEDDDASRGEATAATAPSAQVCRSKLFLVDLAGSERVSDLDDGRRESLPQQSFAEHVAINQSLSALGNVVAALAEGEKKRPHIPYRDSLLTRLLQDALGGNSKTALLACVSPEESHADETARTLRFAERAASIVLGTPVRPNREIMYTGSIEELRKALRKAHAEIDRLKAAGGGGTGRAFLDQAKLAEECCQLRETNAKLAAENARLRKKLKALNAVHDNRDATSTREGETEDSGEEGLSETGDSRPKCEEARSSDAVLQVLDDEEDALSESLAEECARLKKLREEREMLEAKLRALDENSSPNDKEVKDAWKMPREDDRILSEQKQPPTASSRRPNTTESAARAPCPPQHDASVPLSLFGDRRDLGARVDIYSYRFNRSYPGEIILYDSHRKMHCVLYDTGERHWKDLTAGGKQLKVLRPGTAQTDVAETPPSRTCKSPLPPQTPLSLSAFFTKKAKGSPMSRSKSSRTRSSLSAASLLPYVQTRLKS